MGKVVALSTINDLNTRFRIAHDYTGIKALEQNRGKGDARGINYGKLQMDLKKDKKFVARNPVSYGLLISVDNRVILNNVVDQVIGMAFEDGYTAKLGPLGRYQRLVAPTESI